MKILDRYIARAIATGTGIALLVILGLDIFFNIIGQMDKVGVGTYTLWKMFLFVALTTEDVPVCRADNTAKFI